VEVLLETDPYEFDFGNFHIILIFPSLCVKYPQRKSVCINTQNRFFLVFFLSVDSLLEADPIEFLLVFFSLCEVFSYIC
jgi:hypothetical protein